MKSMAPHSAVAVPVLLAALFVTGCSGERRNAAIEQLAELVESDFVYPDIGKQYAAELRRKLAAGAYSNLSTDADVAAAVNADLQRIHREGHLRLLAPNSSPGSPSETNHTTVYGVGKSEWLIPGVAYMRLHGFTGSEQFNRLREVLVAFSNAKTLIIDARQYVGGT